MNLGTPKQLNTQEEVDNVLVGVKHQDIMITKRLVDMPSFQPKIEFVVRIDSLLKDGYSDILSYETFLELIADSKNTFRPDDVFDLRKWNFSEPKTQELPGYNIGDWVWYHTHQDNNTKITAKIINIFPYSLPNEDIKTKYYVLETYLGDMIVKNWGDLSITEFDNINSIKRIMEIKS